MSVENVNPDHAQEGIETAKEKSTVPVDGSGTFAARWRNNFNAVFSRLSPEDEAQWYHSEELRRWPKSLLDCQKRKTYIMKYSPVIRFLSEKIGQMGGNITTETFPCNFCVAQKSGGFHPKYGIELCANKLRSQSMQEDTMAHELIHAYDHLRFEVDWPNLRHAACSEVRAASLSGECRFMTEFFAKARFTFNKGYQDCVRRRAGLSIQARPNCKDELHAQRIVDEVFDSCMTDTRPFDEVYR